MSTTTTFPKRVDPEDPSEGRSTPSRPDIPRAGRWTGSRITGMIAGSLLIVIAAGLLAGGGATLWADRTQRDSAGYLTVGPAEFSTGAFALLAEGIDFRAGGPEWAFPQSVLDSARIRVAATDPSASLFVGIGPSGEVARYLAGVGRATIKDFGDPRDLLRTAGVAPPAPPTEMTFWATSSTGSGPRTIVWPVEEGTWTVVVMNADGGRGLNVRADVAATAPALLWIAVGSMITGGLLLAGGVVLVRVVVRRPAR